MCSMCNTITVVTPLCYAGICQVRLFLQRWLLWSVTGRDSFKRILKTDYIIIAFKQSNWSYITIYSLYYYSYMLWQSYILVLYNSLKTAWLSVLHWYVSCISVAVAWGFVYLSIPYLIAFLLSCYGLIYILSPAQRECFASSQSMLFSVPFHYQMSGQNAYPTCSHL